jgi:transcriptional regulator with XRE-family HTH domain
VASDLHASTVIQVIAFLKKERCAQGLSQEILARKAGLSRTGIRHIESAQFKPTLYSLLKIAEALRLNLPRVIRKIQIAQEKRSQQKK